jgi:hypothetical protein
MFRSKPNINRVNQVIAGAFLLALIVAASLGNTRVVAARSTTHTTEIASLGGSNSCAAEMQSSDYYLRQEEAVLSKGTQSDRSASEMTSPGSSYPCATEMQSSDYYLRQEEAVLSKGTQSHWNDAEMASLSIALNQMTPKTVEIPITGGVSEAKPAFFGCPDYSTWDNHLREQFQITEDCPFAPADYRNPDPHEWQQLQNTEDFPFAPADYRNPDPHEWQ